MKHVYTIVLITGLLFALYGQAPTFENPVYIYEGASIIDVGWYGAPFAYDWDGDSKKDLLVGQFTQGKIRLYINTGEHINPAFDNSLFLQADAADIVLPYG
jgi:hypothetical protein